MNQVDSGPLTSTATRLSLPVARLDAVREIANDSSVAARWTRAAVAGDTRSDCRSARDTVDTDTPARRATSSMLALIDAVLQARSDAADADASRQYVVGF